MAAKLAEAYEAAITLAGETLTPHPSGALWWEAQRTLVVSDLHLEKGSSYAAKGVLLPPYDTHATLMRLAAVVEQFQPERVIALGDSFHDPDCEARMRAEDVDDLAALVRAAPHWVWIAGNHDPVPPAQLGGEVMEEWSGGPLTFRHEPHEGEAPGEVAGHLHPCARIKRRGRSVRRRCFITDGSRLVAPAFGVFTGGLNVTDRAFEPLFGGAKPVAFMLGRDAVWPVPAHSWRPD